MFFHDAIHRRLVALLRPWLQDEPETELHLGLINSELTVKKFKLDVSALNNESESSRFKFREVTVDHLSLRFSNWSSPACKIGIRGVNITLLAGEVKEEGSLKRERKSSEEKKKAVAGFDPEGSALHDVLERILLNPPSRNWFKTSLSNLVLKHFHFQISDTNLQVQFPNLNDAVVCLLELKEFNGESEHSDPGCLLRGVVGAVFKPLKVVSFVMNFRGFGFAYKMEDQINHISSFTDLRTCIKLNDLRVADVNIRAPKLSLLFSPFDLLVLSAFGKLSTKEPKHVRSGRQLWKLAANRLGYMPSSPRLSLQKLVDFICLWLRYQNAYEYLLSLLGYSADNNLLKMSVIKLSEDKMFLNSVIHNWEEISGIEKELSAEAIAQARRIARYRAVSNIQNGKNSFKESSVDKQVDVFSKILSVFIFIWNAMYRILLSILQCFFYIIFFFQQPKLDWNLGNNSEDYSSRYYFLLNFGKILVMISSTSKHQNVDERIESRTGISYSDTHSLCLSIHMPLLAYVDEIFEQSLSLSCGKLKVKSSSVMEATIVDRSVKNPFSSKTVHRKGNVDKLKTILTCKPAQVFLPSQTSETSVSNLAEGTCNPYLQTLLEEMWLAWQRSSMEYKDNEIACSETPWLLCEIKNCLMDPNLKIPISGFWKCSLTTGKIDLALGYSSVLSLAILLGQIQHALNLNENTGKTSELLDFSPAIENQEGVSWEDRYELYSNRLKLTFLRMLPEKHIQLGVFVTGPRIEMTLLNSGDKDTNQDDYHLGFDIQNIEAVVWPTSKSDLALTGWSESDGAEPESHKLREPRIIEIPKPDNEKYASEGWISLGSYFNISGFDIYSGSPAERERNQIFSLKPIAARLSLFREFVHMFSTTVIAFSAAFSVTASGLSIISYMDELYVLFQVVASLLSTVSLDMSGFMPLQNFLRENMVFNEPENDEISAEGATLICNSTLVLTTGTFKFNSMDVILQNSRIDDKEGNSVKTYAAMSNQMAGHDFPDCGILISVRQTYTEVSFEEKKLEILCDLQGIQFVISRYQDHMLKRFDHSVVTNLLQQSEGGLYEIFLSDFRFAFWLCQPQNSLNNSDGKTSSSGNTSQTADNAHLISECETSTAQSSRFARKLGFATDITSSSSSHWILINVTLGIIFVAKGSLKKSLDGPIQFNKLTALLEVGRNLHTISWGIKGGGLVLETAALTMFFRCVVSYLHRIKHLLSIISSSVKQAENAEYKAQENMTRQTKREWPEASTVDMSQFSLILVVEDGSGGFQELVIEVDVHMKFESTNLLRKFIFNLSRMAIFSQVHREHVENENQIPHFSSDTPSGSQVAPRDKMLNNLVASISVEKLEMLNQVWVGMGSISGFEMTITLSEIQMILSIVSSFSASNIETSSYPKRRQLSSNQVPNCLEDMVPDGAIVAVQDVHQHLYFAVEERESKNSLTGVIHYSLVGEKTLFRVKHHKQRMWKSSVIWFSLISLHAKNNVGEPLRLSYHSGSDFVEISGASDSDWSLWRILPCEPESYNSDIDWEPYNKLFKDTFYLVNKKSGSAVAFVDGVPLFVRKPGHPFKFKMFHDSALIRDVATSDGLSSVASGSNQFPSTHEDEGRISGQCGSLPCIQIKIDYVSVTIVHELLDTRDKFLLLRGCIRNTELKLQILSCKTRVMSTSIALLYYFDVQRNLWRELVHPLEICTFYRSVFHIQDSETVQHGAPVHFYCRSKELDISLNELSLDVLLFVIGKLQLAGPFSLRSSMILSNCCKVENQTGLSLTCHFYNKESVTIARKQSASVFLSQILANQPPESRSIVTIKLSDPGSFATSSLDISILETRALAWRTRIVSLQDSRTYPGPFVVVDISRKFEDGLSIAVSPLIRIHNETEFSMELRFRRSQQNEDVFAPMLLKKGASVDDSMKAFEAIGSSGGLKKALMSFTVGNFLFSFRPEITDDLINSKSPLSAEWSDELKGGKAVCLSGIFDKLGYKVRKALSVDTTKCSFSTACCTLKSGDAHATNLHFLIQSIGRDVPIIQPDESSGSSENMTSAVSLQEQKEIFILPTVRVSNLLHSEIHVLLTEKGLCTTVGSDSFGKQAAIPCGSTVDFYANPAILYFTITLTAFSMSCKPVNSGDWVKKLLKKKNKVHFLDIDLEFGGGKYFASLRLSRGHRGILEVSIFTQYSLKNDTEFSLFMFAPHQKPLSGDEVRKFCPTTPPDLGLFSPPNSTRSWFLKSHKVRLKLLEDYASEALLDLDALSGLTEISLEKEDSGEKSIVKFGISVGPSSSSVMVPAQIVTMVPRHVVFNESEENITVRQCYLEKDEATSLVHVNSKQRTALKLRNGISKRKEFSLFENVIRKHKNDIDTSLVYIQFQLNDPESSWSGPVCIVSLGRFFIKFRKQSNQAQALDNSALEFAAIHVVEEGSTVGVHFHKPPNVTLPYRIENHLHGAFITFYQKELSEREILGSDCSAYYVWDDLTLPHKLVVVINDLQREINLDKVRAWKPFLKSTKHRGLVSHSFLHQKSRDQKRNFDHLNSMDIVKVGYEVYAEGTTRVLRICEFLDSHKGDRLSQLKIQVRVFHFAIHFLEHEKKDFDEVVDLSYTPLIVARLGNISVCSVFTDLKKFNLISVQSLNVDQKWLGSPFAAMLRRHQSDFSDSNASVLEFVGVLLSTNSNVRQLEYSSMVLQPIDLNLDEETLMRLASFWRTSLSDSRTPSQQYYFDHFEIHPIKIITNFLPGDSYSSYNSAQETLRSLLHSVVKVPPIKNMVVELNGVLVTHALITMRELFIRCAQHYTWYGMRAIYIAKGSHLLPPAFASIFDDLASSSLDVYFDPSRGLINIPGFTLGTFKFLSKCIDARGFSGTKRYFGDLEKTLRTVGSNVLFVAATQISDSVLKEAETNGFDGMASGFHQGILKLAMEPSLLGTALIGGGPDRKVKLDRNPGIDELYVEGYLQAMLDTMYRQEYLRVRVIDDQVFLKNLPPNSALIDEIMDRVKGFLVSKGLLKGDPSTSSRPLRHLQGESFGTNFTIEIICKTYYKVI
ncbi:VACUOLAR PROTEIN SORTING-ASSOCIATED PROTEIN VPS13 [Salix viminalis]|uniref:VACUOLAR PROTEIN SORTING-ASSOCIATED PROTEIN VPS13 n=1 Tax=Salix viminalis TaxID=40686 RepID=A0A9Q0NYZ2_SALVM|nr:VACUOLAR PROTEIN SORTING-ASSOCIATED PROTEIN VPS13 [Salix viminalis]